LWWKDPQRNGDGRGHEDDAADDAVDDEDDDEEDEEDDDAEEEDDDAEGGAGRTLLFGCVTRKLPSCSAPSPFGHAR